ncbi:MAG: NUDIX domain-containing protein [Candidatus Moraniibacteriota bacterium]|nr:MAG: NUDIX domain-containing protein [Candidatus Moranbacteria bacterium]
MSEKIIIVDSNDALLGAKERSLLRLDDIYRVSALWIFDSQKRVLLAKRALVKKHYPGKWGAAVVGMNAAGETYEETIRREAMEEVGLNLSESDLKIGPIEHIKDEYEHFTQWYWVTVDCSEDTFLIDPQEVDQVKWFTRDEVFAMYADSPENFVPSFRPSFDVL